MVAWRHIHYLHAAHKIDVMKQNKTQKQKNEKTKKHRSDQQQQQHHKPRRKAPGVIVLKAMSTFSFPSSSSLLLPLSWSSSFFRLLFSFCLVSHVNRQAVHHFRLLRRKRRVCGTLSICLKFSVLWQNVSGQLQAMRVLVH